MASATGATVHIHYCMGKFAGISFSHSEEDKCHKCGMKKAQRSKNCCKDDYKTFKANDHQQAKVIFDFSNTLSATIPQPYYLVYSELVFSQNLDRNPIALASPPYRRTCPIYLLVQDFRI